MSVNQSSVVKDCVRTTVTCGLAVGAVSAVVGAIAFYHQELLALGVMMVAFGVHVGTLLGPVALWLSQDLPSAVKWMLAGAFLWSFCVSRNLNKKRITGRYATVVNRTKVILICGFCLYWLVQLFIQIDAGGRLIMVSVLLMFAFLFYMLCCLQNEQDKMVRVAREPSEQDAVQVQGADQ